MYRIDKQSCMQYLTICVVKRHYTLYTTTSIKLPVRCRIWTWNAANTKTYWGEPNPQLVRSKSWSFHCERIQWNFLKQTAASRCDGFPMFWGLTSSPPSGCAGGCLVEPNWWLGVLPCAVYISVHRAWYGMWPLWLVGGVKRLLHLARAAYCWLWRMFPSTNYWLPCMT